MKKILVLCLMFLTACGPSAFVKGDYDTNVEKTNLLTDQWSESDMQNAVKALVSSAENSNAVMSAKRVPVVMVTKLQNKTSEIIDTQSITDMITAELMRSGKLSFVDKSAREDMANEIDYQSENASRETRKNKGQQTAADFILNGRLDSIVQEAGRDKTVYYKVSLNLTNLQTGLIVWTDYKQIRKIFKKKHLGI